MIIAIWLIGQVKNVLVPIVFPSALEDDNE